MKTKPTKPTTTAKQESHPPVTVAMPNTTAEKMRAIASLAVAVENLSRALCSVNTHVHISHCSIVGAETGITLKEDA